MIIDQLVYLIQIVLYSIVCCSVLVLVHIVVIFLLSIVLVYCLYYAADAGTTVDCAPIK